jgi:hypothetical protein
VGFVVEELLCKAVNEQSDLMLEVRRASENERRFVNFGKLPFPGAQQWLAQLIIGRKPPELPFSTSEILVRRASLQPRLQAFGLSRRDQELYHVSHVSTWLKLSRTGFD